MAETKNVIDYLSNSKMFTEGDERKLTTNFDYVKKYDHRGGDVSEVRERTIISQNWEVVHVVTRPKQRG